MIVTYRMMFLLSIPVTISAQCTLTPDSENVVATQLAGDWQINRDLPDFNSGYEKTAITFTDNPSIVDMLPEEYCDVGPLFMAGEMTYIEEQVTYPYVLTSIHGNPNILFLCSFDYLCSFKLMIARAEDKTKDILFIGGRQNNQPFSAFSRMEI